MSYHQRAMRNLLFTAIFVATHVEVPLVRALPPQASGGSGPTVSNVKVLRFGKLWDGSKVMINAVVVIDGERVKSVGSGNSTVPSNSQVVDLSKFKDYIDRNMETVRRAIKDGVRIGMGSDAVFTIWGQNARDLPLYVECGMTAEQALASATRVNATLLPMEKSLGAVAPGGYADIVALQGDPLADINVVLKGVRWVMKGGRVVVNKTETALSSSSNGREAQ